MAHADTLSAIGAAYELTSAATGELHLTIADRVGCKIAAEVCRGTTRVHRDAGFDAHRGDDQRGRGWSAGGARSGAETAQHHAARDRDSVTVAGSTELGLPD